MHRMGECRATISVWQAHIEVLLFSRAISNCWVRYEDGHLSEGILIAGSLRSCDAAFAVDFSCIQ